MPILHIHGAFKKEKKSQILIRCINTAVSGLHLSVEENIGKSRVVVIIGGERKKNAIMRACVRECVEG